MDGEPPRERKDSRQVNNNAASSTTRRSSRLGHQNANLSGPFRGGFFETVDELANLDAPQTRNTSDRRVSQVSISHGAHDSGVRGRRASLTRSPSMQASPSGGIVNPTFETKDALDDLDPSFRKLSVVAARRMSIRPPNGKLDESKDGEPEEQFFFKAPLSRSTKVLISTSIIFFLIAEIMTSIYLLEVYKEPPPKSCDSESCLVFGQLLRGSLNLSANPCTDFYSYACGNFQRRTPYGDQYRDLDGLVNDELVVRMHEALENLKHTVRNHEDYERKAWQFYEECLEIDSMNVRESLVEVLQNLSWPLITPPESPSTPLLELFKEAHIHGADPFFHVSRLPNHENPSQPYWTVQEGKLSLPLPVYDSPLYRTQYALFIQNLVAEVRATVQGNLVTDLDPVTLDVFERIVDLEAELADVRHEPQFFKLTIREFSDAYPAIARNYNLVEYFVALTKADEHLDLVPARNQTASITENTVIIMKNRDYFYILNEMLRRTTERDQSIYLGWRVLFHYIDLIDEDPVFWGIVQRFWMSIGNWPRQYHSHGKNCAQTAIDALPDGGLALYRKQHFSTNQTTQINDILDRLTRTATEVVNSQEWMSDQDKKAAASRFQNLKRQLPYSEELYSKNLTNQLYSKSVVEYDSFFLTIRNFQRVRQHFVLSGIYDNPIEFPDLLSFAFGADYRLDNPNQGLVGVLPRTFVAPFYDSSYPSFANYAMLGFLYARELAHVVDYEWFMLNRTSGESSGPSNSTLQQYHSGLGYILELYRNTSIVLGLPVNYETLYEDSADQAALRISYRAYQDVIRRANDALFPGIPYDNFDFSQMFFLTVAQRFCVNEHSIRLKDVTNIGFSHPRVRLTALMYNSEEFDTAFSCGRAANGDWTGQQLLHIPDPPRKVKYRTNITAKQIDEWYHWYERKPGLPTWPRAW